MHVESESHRGWVQLERLFCAPCVELHLSLALASNTHSLRSVHVLAMKVVLLPAVPFIEASEELHVEFPVPSRLLFEMHISTFTGGVVTHSQPVSIEHCTEHPSPFKVLPSSQISEA